MKRHTLFVIISILAIMMSYMVIAGCSEEEEYYCLESCIDRCNINEETQDGLDDCLDDCDANCSDPACG